jgi:hypothetical protein
MESEWYSKLHLTHICGADAPHPILNIYIKEGVFQMAEFITNDSNRPVTFNLPDNDEVALIPWQYVLDRLTEDLQPTITEMQSINVHLNQISTKLNDWIPKEGE